MTEDEIIPWLLQDDAAIQYQVYRDLLDTHRPDLQHRIAEEGWGKAFLARRNPNGHWGKSFYQPKRLNGMNGCEMPWRFYGKNATGKGFGLYRLNTPVKRILTWKRPENRVDGIPCEPCVYLKSTQPHL